MSLSLSLSSWSFLLSSSVSLVLLPVTMVRGLLASSSSYRIWSCAAGGAVGAVPASISWAAASAGGEELVDVALVGVAMVLTMMLSDDKCAACLTKRAKRRTGLVLLPRLDEKRWSRVPVSCVCEKE